jgi:hypothetical protein
MNKALIAVLLVALLAVARADPIANDEPEMPSVDADVEEHEQAMEDVEESGVGHLKGDGGNSDSKLDAKETKDSNPDSDLEEDVEENDEQPEADVEENDEQPEADVEEEASRHNSEANKIRRLLSKIKAKLIRELRNAKRYVARVQARENKRVAAARRRYVRATRRSRHQHNIRMWDLGRYRAARRRRVRVMRHSRLHQKRVVLRRERELVLIHMIECRLYELTGANRLAKRCHRAASIRRNRYHHRLAMSRGVVAKVYSGYCSRHSRGRGWARYCLNRREFQQGRYVTARGNGVVYVRKTGHYRVHARAIQYCANWCHRHIRTLISGRQRDYAYKQHAHSWVENEVDKIHYIRAGQNIQIQMYSTGSNPYRWHSGNGRGAHSRVQITYMGGKPFHSAMCSRSRGRGWHWYCTNRTERTNSRFFKRGSNYIRVKRTGMYRINARALIYTRGWGPHHQAIYINNRRVSYTHDYKVYWAVTKGDVMWPMKAGQYVRVKYYSNNGHAYHSGHFSGAHSNLQISYEGARNRPVASYACRHHNRSRRHWRTYCLNRREFDYGRRYFKVYSSGQIRIKRTGTYRINAWALSHSGYTWRNSRVLINGSYWSYCHTHDNSWSRLGNDFYWRLRKNQRVHIQYNTNGSYQWHSGPTHSRVQISYEGRY